MQAILPVWINPLCYGDRWPAPIDLSGCVLIEPFSECTVVPAHSDDHLSNGGEGCASGRALATGSLFGGRQARSRSCAMQPLDQSQPQPGPPFSALHIKEGVKNVYLRLDPLTVSYS